MNLREPNLQPLFEPQSVAVIGASNDRNKLGGRALRYALARQFQGPVYPVNPRYTNIGGRRCFPEIEAVPGTVDLAVIAVPARAVLPTLERCAAAAVRAAVVLSAGFAETGEEGRRAQEGIARISERSGMIVCGPNSLGVINFETGMAATFSQGMDVAGIEAGGMAVVSQSGFFGTLLFVLASRRGVGCRLYVSTGNEAVLTFADYVAWLARDPLTRIVVGYIEGLRDGGKFLTAARAVRDAGKVFVAIKVGRSRTGSLAAQSHTGAMTGTHAVYEAAFRENGVIAVDDEETLVDVAALLDVHPARRYRNIGILTISGGAGILMTDLLERGGLCVPALAEATRQRLAAVLPDIATTANPVDATGNALSEPDMLRDAAQAMLEDAGLDAVLVVLGMFEFAEDRIVAAMRQVMAKKPLMFVWPAASMRALGMLREAKIVSFSGTAAAARALTALRTPERTLGESSSLGDAPSLRATVKLGEPETKALLARFNIPIVRERAARDASAALATMCDMRYPVAVKIDAPDLAHKSDAGGVLLGIRSDRELTDSVDRVFANVSRAHPELRPRGVLVSEMVATSFEIIAGVTRDASFGPVVTVGAGGTAAEILRDTAVLLPPFDNAAARAAIASLRCAPLLSGYRASRPFDVDALAHALECIGELALAMPGLVELDVNPIKVLPAGEGIRVVDAFAVVEGRTYADVH